MLIIGLIASMLIEGYSKHAGDFKSILACNSIMHYRDEMAYVDIVPTAIVFQWLITQFKCIFVPGGLSIGWRFLNYVSLA